MTVPLIRRSLLHYWRTNLAVVAGVAIAVSVLAGALLVGHSVRASLRRLALEGLGNTHHVVASTGFFRERLATELGGAPLIALEAAAIEPESGRRASQVDVYGVDERFWKFQGHMQPALDAREAMLTPALAAELGNPGSILVRVEKTSGIPAESLLGRREDLARSLRLAVRPEPAPGFSLRPRQGGARAVFVPLRLLQRELTQPGRANTLLLGPSDDAARRLADKFELEDLGIKLRAVEAGGFALEQESALIEDALVEPALAAARKLGLEATPVLTYLANTIRANGREVPYSLVAAYDAVAGRAPEATGIVLNDWAARDLGAKPGDPVTLEYFVWREDGRLETESAQFVLASIVPMQGAAADRQLAPEYPGITDASTLGNWDPPFPIDLKKVRPVDEEYWKRYRATPKAFLPLARGRELWKSRFGTLTSLRLTPPAGQDTEQAMAAYRAELRRSLDPARHSLAAHPARAQALEASRGATDFGEYFVYFSFFLVLSALMLSGLFFKLGVEQRWREIGTLQAAGFSLFRIREMFLEEGIVLSALGSFLGCFGAVGYAWLILYGLRTWWVGAAGTTLLAFEWSLQTLILGAVGGVIVAAVTIAWSLRVLRHATPRSLLAGAPGGQDRAAKIPRWTSALVLILAAGGMLVAAALELLDPVAGFFGAGSLLLLAALRFEWIWLSRRQRRVLASIPQLGFRGASERPGRSILSIALIAAAAFILVAAGAFRRGAAETEARSSGTGGYPLIAESVVPIVHDPNGEAGREALSITPVPLDGVRFVRFRLRPGDDASCLNLYQPRNPRILGAPQGFLREGRFSFADSLAQTDAEKANPWLLLESAPVEGAIPAIVDANSMTYVLHRKLGDIVETGPVRLRLVAALRDSMFQSELIVSEDRFLRAFPEQQGHRVFLIDGPREIAASLAAPLEDALSDYGFDAAPAAERLAMFHRVENTYISTFQSLGALGLVLGTFGLAAVLLRNVLERRRELALLRAVGYQPRNLGQLILSENVFLLVAGLVTGTVCALVAVAPAMAARGSFLSGYSLPLMLAAVLAAGLAASLAATAAALRSELLGALRSE
jgi:putative ABC transport system permease protein